MKQRGYLSISVTLLVVFISIVAGSSFWNVRILHQVEADRLREECNIIDLSLEAWSKSHRAVREETIRYLDDGRVIYAKKRLYPESLQELKELNYLTRGGNGNAFRYITRGEETEYRLEVILPTGGMYVSRGSTF